MTLRFLILAGVLALAACGPDDGGGSDDDSIGPVDGKADIYGDDSRVESTDPEAALAGVAVADSVALVFGSSAIVDIGAETYTLSSQTMQEKWSRQLDGPVCSTERFLEQPAPGFCSGFLIGPQHVATAGHCININSGCERIFFTFGFENPRGGDASLVIPQDDVYRCDTVVGHQFDQGEQTLAEIPQLWQDWAVVRLDRPVRGIEPVDVTDGTVAQGQRVVAVGHPSGLPMKVTPGSVFDASPELYFNTDLDIYRGNSGSAVVDNDARAVGIVSRGTGGRSFVRNDDGCFESRICENVGDPGCTGNHVIRSRPLIPFAGADVEIAKQSTVAFNGAISSTERTFHIDLEADFDASFVTLNVNGFHPEPKDLHVTLEKDGKSVPLLVRPRVWKPGSFRMSRTSFEFAGTNANGRWAVKVRDVDDDDNRGKFEWLQIVVGSSGASTPPPPREPFVGKPCVSDEECGFNASGAEGFCYTFDGDARGFCSVPCEGFCPDKSGWATTFCVGSEVDGMGICASKSEPLNDSCGAIPGTAPTDRDRFIGSSSASPSSATVCLP